MPDETRVDEAAVRAMAAAVDLPMLAEREAAVAAQLSVWLTAANELNRKMASAEHWQVTPVTVFTHPPQEVEEA
jgi:hypothetical protein